MSNTSYHSKQIKENNQVTIQGGEKKVMKKILSVALSTAMAFSMFASVAFGDDAKLTSQQKFDVLKDAKILTGYQDGSAGLERDLTRAEFAKVVSSLMGLKPITGQLSFKDKGYTAKNWAVPYIEAVYSAGLMEGKNTTKMIFDYNGKITVQEMAAVLVRAMKLEVPAETDNAASAWAKGYVQAAVNAGIISKDAAPKANATRSQMVDTAYAIWIDQQQPKVVSYEVKEGGKVVEFKLANDSVVKVTLEKALEANKETEVAFENGGYKYNEKVTWVVTTATKVESAAASNLKEVIVTFDGKVDKDTAEEVSNYSLKSGKIIQSATLAADEKTVTLTVQGTLNNNKAEALSVSNVKAGTATITVTNLEFTTVDNTLPVVESVESLGTKSVKVVFSEPVSGLVQSNFTLDGKTFYGKVDMGANNRSAILTPYSSGALAVGEHKLAASQVKDYAGFVALSKDFDFTVVEDTTAPTVTESSATLESVTVTFSEVVDPSTISGSNVYWMSGTSKKTATAGTPVKVADNKYKFVFGAEANSLPTGAVTVYVTGVKDYSGNAIAANTSFVVNPTIDQTRPEVTRVAATNERTIKVTFNKEVLGTSVIPTANYTVTNKDGKNVSVREAKVDPSDAKSILVYTYTDLSAGDNTIAVRNIKDTTKLQNTMLDYSGTVTLGDTGAPSIDSKIVSVKDNRVVIAFSEKMDIASLTNNANYYATINGTTVPFSDSLVTYDVMQDGKAVAITFAETYNGKKVNFADAISSTDANVSSITVLAVKDLAGNFLKNFTGQNQNTIKLTEVANQEVKTVDYDSDHANKVAKLVDTKTIKVKFNAPILDAKAGAFSYKVGGVEQVASVDVDSTSVVTVNLRNAVDTDAAGLSLDVDYSQLVTAAGNTGSGSTAVVPSNLIDAVAPELKAPTSGVLAISDQKILIPYSEELNITDAALAKGDFKIHRVSDSKDLDASKDYSVGLSTDKKTVEITLLDKRAEATEYKVVAKDVKYIVDKGNNAIANVDNVTGRVAAYKAPAAVTTVTATAAPATLTVPTNATPAESTITAVIKDQYGDTMTSENVTLEVVGAPTGVSVSNNKVTVVQGASAGKVEIKVASVTDPTKSTIVEITLN